MIAEGGTKNVIYLGILEDMGRLFEDKAQYD